ncbi:MAG TPA: mandelate racemase/muconate lactonizing enzyme family protein [Alphaproteobacteria bacterium]|nr:mandelate racemase/muconate lactonizing enzyme family protein [Alphaproteobacteria bacterium]
MTPSHKDCRITRIDTYVVGARWCNWVFAHVFTDDGIEGVGEGSCEFQPQAVVAVIEQLARRVVIGRSAFQIEKLWQEMFRNEFARGGPILNSGIGAIEIAMWDIVGQALGRPIYDLLGGRIYERLPAYANAWYGAGASREEIAAAARQVARKGYRGLKFDPFADAGRDPPANAIREAVDLVAAVRDAVGPDMEVLIDAHGRFSPGTAIRVARDLERFDVYWFEEPTDPENVQALQKIGRAMRLRLATGERCYTKYHLQALLGTNDIGVLQPDIVHVGGILEAKKFAAIADAQYIPVSYHNPFGPVATAAAIQLDSCTTNFIMQESFCEWTPEWRFDLLEHPPRPVDGHYAVPVRPGLGVGRFRPDAARAHPFDPDAFLPMWKENWRQHF